MNCKRAPAQRLYATEPRQHLANRKRDQGQSGKLWRSSQLNIQQRESQDHPASPLPVLMPALASPAVSLTTSMCTKPPFLLFPSHHRWAKTNPSAEQLFGNMLLHCWRAGREPMPVLTKFHSQNLDYLMQFFGTLSNTTQNYISVIRGKD